MSDVSSSSLVAKSVQKEDLECEALNGFMCSVCLDLFRFPKILPSCGHSFCLECLEKVAAESLSITCPECRAVSQCQPKDLVSNVHLAKAIETFAQEKIKLTANTKSGRLSEDKCPHVSLVKCSSSCCHCSQKFCSKCEIVHKELMKQELLKLESNSYRTLDETLASLQVFVGSQMSEAEEQIETSFLRLRENITTAIEKQKAAFLNCISDVGEAKLTMLRKCVENVRSLSVPETASEMASKSVLKLSCDELSTALAKALLFDKEVQSFKELRDNCTKEKLNVIDTAVLEEEIVAKLNALKVTDCVSWMDQNQLMKRLHDQLLSASADGNLNEIRSIFGKSSPDMKDQLLQRNDADDLFFQAVRHGQTAIVEFFLTELNVDIKNKLTQKDRRNALHVAVRHGNGNTAQLVQFLCGFVKKTFDNDGSSAIINLRDANLHTPLCLAANRGCLHIVRILVENGADIYSISKDGYMPVHWACLRGHFETVMFLLSKDIDRRSTKDWSMVELAEESKNQDLVRMLQSLW